MARLLEPGPPGTPWYLWNLGLRWPEGKGGQRVRPSVVPTGSSPLIKSSPINQKTFLPEPRSQSCPSGIPASTWNPVGGWEHGRLPALLTPRCTLHGPSAEAFS